MDSFTPATSIMAGYDTSDKWVIVSNILLTTNTRPGRAMQLFRDVRRQRRRRRRRSDAAAVNQAGVNFDWLTRCVDTLLNGTSSCATRSVA
jgi:hypothetical protein